MNKKHVGILALTAVIFGTALYFVSSESLWGLKSDVVNAPIPVMSGEVIPTFTVNGSHDITVNATDPVIYKWSWVGKVFSFNYISQPLTWCTSSWPIPLATAYGTSPGLISLQPGCTYAIQYVASDGNTANVTFDSVIVRVNKLNPKAALTISSGSVNNSHDITINPGDTVTYNWSSTNGKVFSSNYTSQPISCGSSSWSATSSSGTISSTILPSQAGCTYSIQYVVSDGTTSNVTFDDIIVRVNKITPPTLTSATDLGTDPSDAKREKVRVFGQNIPASISVWDLNTPNYQNLPSIPVGNNAGTYIDLYISKPTTDHTYNIQVGYQDPSRKMLTTNPVAITLRAVVVSPALCNSLTVSPSSLTNGGTFTYSCSGTNTTSYSITMKDPNGKLSSFNTPTGTITIPASLAGTYAVSCFVNNQTTTPASCQQSVTNSQTNNILTVSNNSTYPNQTQSPNTASVKIGSFVFKNQSSSEGVRVTSLTVGLGGTSALTNLSGLKTSETSGSGSKPIQPQASNTFSVDFTLAPGATKTIDIFADTGSATGVTVISTLAVNAIGASSNTTTYVAAVTGQTITLSSGTVATPTLNTSASTPAQTITVGSTPVEGSHANYVFSSTGGNSTITELKFTMSGTAVDSVTQVRVGSVVAPVVGGVAWLKRMTHKGWNSVVAPVVGGVAWLQGLNIPVANGTSVPQDVYFTYGKIDGSSVVSGSTVISTLSYVKYSSGGMTTVITPSVAAPMMTLQTAVTVPTTTLNITLDKVVSTPNQYLQNNLSPGSFVQYNIISNGGPSIINEIKFDIIDSASSNSIKSIQIGNISASIIGHTAWLQGLNIPIPDGGSGKPIQIAITYNNVDNNTLPSGTSSYVDLSYIKYSSGTSSTVILPEVYSTVMTLVWSVPSVYNYAPSVTGLILGSENKMDVMGMAVSTSGDIKVNQIVFNLGFDGFSTNPTITNPRITDGKNTIPNSTCIAASSQKIVCKFGTNHFDGYTISAGTTKEFTLYATNISGVVSTWKTALISTSLDPTSFSWDDVSGNWVKGVNLNGAWIFKFPASQTYTIQQ